MESELVIKKIMKILQPLSVNNKLEIISRLTNELRTDISSKDEFNDEFYGSVNDNNEKSILINELKEAVENMRLVREGKLKARSAKDLLNEL